MRSIIFLLAVFAFSAAGYSENRTDGKAVGNMPYYKITFMNDAGQSMNLFGSIPSDMAKRAQASYEKWHLREKSTTPEMFEILKFQPSNSSTATVKTIEKIGEGFVLNPYDLAVRLSKETADYVEKSSLFINIPANQKSILIFAKKGVEISKLKTNDDVAKVAEISFYPEDTSSK